MRNRKQIYEKLVDIKYAEFRHPLSRDQAERKANIYAVKNTEREFQAQFKGDKLLYEIIRLFDTGQNIHGIKRLLNLTRSEVVHALEKGYTK